MYLLVYNDLEDNSYYGTLFDNKEEAINKFRLNLLKLALDNNKVNDLYYGKITDTLHNDFNRCYEECCIYLEGVIDMHITDINLKEEIML